MKRSILLLIFCALLLPFSVARADILPDMEAMDMPNDSGHAIVVRWRNRQETGSTLVQIAAEPSGPWHEVEKVVAGTKSASELPEVYGWGEDLDRWQALVIKEGPLPVEELKRSRFEKKQMLDQTQAAIDDLAGVQSKGGKRRLEQLKKRKESLLLALEENVPVDPLVTGHTYYVRVFDANGSPSQALVSSAKPVGQWYNTNKTINLLLTLALAGFILNFIRIARSHPERLFIRRIAGLEAVDDAVGRATEMGRPILFVHGLTSIDSISTIAGLNILGKLAERVAEFSTEFKVTNRDPVVMAVSQETVKESYLKVGRPELYHEDHVFFISDNQFAYATGVEGIMLRERPAAVFYFGYYFAESMLMAETGVHVGAIQVAGTDAYTQLPFFITTCDYTLMGEELYAASAYLSREPMLLGSLKAQDMIKAALLAVMVAGVTLSTFGVQWVSRLLETF